MKHNDLHNCNKLMKSVKAIGNAVLGMIAGDSDKQKSEIVQHADVKVITHLIGSSGDEV